MTSDQGKLNGDVVDGLEGVLSQKVVRSILAMQDLDISFDKILGIEKKLDDLFEQFGDFRSRLTPALYETGLLRPDVAAQPPSAYPNSRLSAIVRRLRDVIGYIEENGLLDENTFKTLKSIFEEIED
ncbi:MAG: hypothetical protein IGR80_16550 [Synechococcales cyanobacterium K44_A2020_017]|nr:hypothetical protein [Synechococcales cyanobacterium K32_A2020_035]MBF2096349.1 hypothetical protein [Synechococcales cyanobacterium K44_A2020_017]